MDEDRLRLAASAGRPTLPALGPRGEGWIALQTGLAVAALLAGGFAGPAWAGTARTVSDVAGLGLMAAGVGLFAWGTLTLGSSFSIWVDPRPAGSFIEDGPYRYLRHPVCTAQAVFGFGWALLGASPLGLGLVAAYALYLELGKLAREEETLLARYPEYAAYRRRVPHRLVPHIG
ncbi:MAG TPA: isoprenylcysteine carboxylmethyltransferase family protein [Candidatus Limnocylindrales bacterium]